MCVKRYALRLLQPLGFLRFFFKMVDDHDFSGAFGRLQFEAELFLHGFEKSHAAWIVVLDALVSAGCTAKGVSPIGSGCAKGHSKVPRAFDARCIDYVVYSSSCGIHGEIG